MDIISLIILIILVFLVVASLCFLASLPGKIARKRNHPQKEAIKVCGWLGLLTGGLSWVIALVWAYVKEDNQ